MSASTNGLNLQQNTSKLTIYTYDSLLADPGYDFVGNFSVHANIPRNDIKLVKFSDAGSMLSRVIAERNNPIADVIIGLDNVLIHKARQFDVLQPYLANGTNKLRSSLVNELAPDHLLTPYDYGVFAIWYDTARYNGISANNFTLTDLIKAGVSDKLIIENPLISSVGSGFLLWAISEFGDNALNFTTSTNWRTYFSQLQSRNVRLVPSWGDALNLFFTPEEHRPMMVSYTTSPAYGACLYGGDTTKAVVSNHNGTKQGWFQIEGLGIAKGAAHPQLAKTFIDWFISPELQTQISTNQWMYPALNNISLPSCFTNSTIPASSIQSLNSRIPTKVLNSSLEGWKSDWEKAWATSGGAFLYSNLLLPLGLTLFVTVIILRKRRKY